MTNKTLIELEKDLMEQVMTLARFIRSMVDDNQGDTCLFRISAECLVHKLIRIDEANGNANLRHLNINIVDIGEDIE